MRQCRTGIQNHSIQVRSLEGRVELIEARVSHVGFSWEPCEGLVIS
jgi:hypothetical protein